VDESKDFRIPGAIVAELKNDSLNILNITTETYNVNNITIIVARVHFIYNITNIFIYITKIQLLSRTCDCVKC